MSFILLLMLFSVTIQAQEGKVEIRVERQEAVKDGEIIIYSDGDVMLMDGENAPGKRIQVESFKGDAVEVNGNQIRVKGFQKDGEPGQDQVEKPSSETRRMNREQGMSPDGMKEFDARRRIQERIDRGNSQDERKAGEMAKTENAKKEGERPGGANKAAGSNEDGLKRYMDAVVNKNLFLPLGSGAEEKKSSYAVTALMSTNTDSRKLEDKAIIQELGSNKGYYVSEGDSFAGNVKVLAIDDNEVKLNRSGEEMTLKLGEGTGRGDRGGWSGSGGGKPSGDQKGKQQEVAKKQENASRAGGDNFDPSQIPPFALEILKQRGISIEELQNNPELREGLRREFIQRFGEGSGEGRRRNR